MRDINLIKIYTISFVMGLILLYRIDLCRATPYDAKYYDTSEYLIGDVYVKAFFVESSTELAGATENWTEEERSACISTMTYAFNWIESQFPYSSPGVYLSISFSTETVVVTSTEPIQGQAGPFGYPSGGGAEGLWVQEIMDQKGYNIYTSTYHNVANYLDDLRTANNADWAVCIFFVDCSSDSDKDFANGRDFFASGTGGPYAVLVNDMTEYNPMWEIYAHEFAHTFYVMDEYNQPMYDATDRQGYLDEDNSNYLGGDGEACIMYQSSPTKQFCTATKEVLGWRDIDGDDIPDILDVEPESNLDEYLPDPTTNTTLTYTGITISTPLANSNSYSDYCPLHDTSDPPLMSWTTQQITINEITLVQYSVLTATEGVVIDWTNAAADDGNFDGTVESFTFTTASLSTGTYIVRTRARNSVNIWETTFSSDTITIILPTDSTEPAAITTLSALTGSGGGEIILSWIAPGDDGTIGTANQYDIRYSTAASQSPAISTATFGGASSVSEFSPIPDPLVAGSTQSMTITGLTGGATYYFAIRTADEVSNWGDLSNGGTTWAQVVILSVSISTDTISGGIVNAASNFNIANSSVGVTNTGNVFERFILSCSSISTPGNWTVTGSTPTTNSEFRLMGIFNSIQPVSGNYDINIDTITDTPSSASAVRYSGDQTGNNVPIGDIRWLWISFDPPTSGPPPPSGDLQNITITIDVEQQP
ncbi:hypothetical protein GTN66_07375 [bacterium]|nr:hypothetical protein [bacterium]NIN93286.1 hypothetical protein [bacterium]NIO19081.1 hypothetical protein [bacterium]NIO74212.1 hypothetical protein [bacterium]